VTEDERHLLAAIEVARRARENGNHPFGAVLVDDTGTIVLEAENTVVTTRDSTGHAETNLVRAASQRFDPELLRRCTLYTSTEPCQMCAGAIHYAGIPRVVFALSQEGLRTIAGPEDGPDLEVSGPHLEEQARSVHEGFWE
jgi:tRNA(Arg) A34 adenosine deaminase TadA